MNPEIKAKWIAALTSGEYEQTRNYLHRIDDGYCCLGVLCEVMDPGQWRNGICINAYGGKYVPIDADPQKDFTSFPPFKLLDAAGLSDAQAQMLARMNDNEDASFGEIAQYIRTHL